jgi:hypothetical protein
MRQRQVPALMLQGVAVRQENALLGQVQVPTACPPSGAELLQHLRLAVLKQLATRAVPKGSANTYKGRGDSRSQALQNNHKAQEVW